MRVFFVTSNATKFAECQQIKVELASARPSLVNNVEIRQHDVRINEVLVPKLYELVRLKAIEAYRLVRQPCVVEHGGLVLQAWRSESEMRGAEMAVGRVVWDAVGTRMCQFLREWETRSAEAHSSIGYCDGRRIHVFQSFVPGIVIEGPRGNRGLRWDSIFRPIDDDLTFGEMSEEQRRRKSPERQAWLAFFESLSRASRAMAP